MRAVLCAGLLLGMAGCTEPPSDAKGGASKTAATGAEGAGLPFSGPVSTVILKPDPDRPTSVDTPRNRLFCEQFVQNPRPAVPAQGTGGSAIQSVWLETVEVLPPGADQDCSFLLEHYDIQRSQQIAQKIQTAGDFGGQGPYLVLLNRGEAVVASGSSIGDFGPFVRSWNEALDKTDLQVAEDARKKSDETAKKMAEIFGKILLGLLIVVAVPAVLFVGGAGGFHFH